MSVALRCGGLTLAAGLAALTLWPAGAGEAKYPRVNTARTYVVDPKWPQKPAEYTWGHVPGLAVDAQDNVYVFTRAEPPVQVYSADGKFLRAWGEKKIKNAHHLRIGPDGNVWLTDIDRHVVEKYTPDGKRLMQLGTENKAGRDQATFNMPTDVAVTPAGDIYVSDGYGNARVVQFDKAGKFVRAWGELGHQRGQFSIPHSIAVDSKGRLYVADRNNVRIQVFAPDGKFVDEWRDLIVPWGLWITKNDEIWACGSSPMQWREKDSSVGVPPKDQLFLKFHPSGRVQQIFTLPKGIDGLERIGEVNWVHALAVDSRGNLYVGDIKGRRAQKFVVREP